MPQTSAAKKALRASQKKRRVNDRWRKAMHDTVHAVQEAITQNNPTAAREAFSQAQKMLDKTAKKNIIHPNAAARKKSRLSRAIAALKQ